MIGNLIYDYCRELFYINRSITGNGVRETLKSISKKVNNFQINEVPSGTKCFDWKVPKEWNVNDAFIADEKGNKIIDFKDNNIHLVGYSKAVDKVVSYNELMNKLYTIPEMPNVIPYITSYYSEDWGFCVTENQKNNLKKQNYHVKIDSSLKNGSLTYGEVLIKGESKKEIIFSTYICHPSLANDNLSGPVLATYLAMYLQKIKKLRFSYRFIFIPETIGAIAYLNKNLNNLKKNTYAGFILTCVGDNNNYSYLSSRNGDNICDIAALHVLNYSKVQYKKYSFLDRGSDERQYSSPGIDLPFCSVMRSKYGEFDEYHTSLDNLDFVSPEGFEGSYNMHKKIIDLFECNFKYKSIILAEPQLGKRGLYPNKSTKKSHEKVRDMMNLISYSDGKKSLLEIANEIKVPIWDLSLLASKLIEHKILKKV
tara:strand:- start:13499 stop:14773 length:1275 start_codon:yes stop_codon:yes gene_type:complete